MRSGEMEPDDARGAEGEQRPLARTEVMHAWEVAELLQVPVSTVLEWARTRRLTSRKRGRHQLFIRAEVERWLLDAD